MFIVLRILPTTAVIMLYQLRKVVSHSHVAMITKLCVKDVQTWQVCAAMDTDCGDEDLKDDIQYKVAVCFYIGSSFQ